MPDANYNVTKTWEGLTSDVQSLHGTMLINTPQYVMFYYPNYYDHSSLTQIGECVIGWSQYVNGETGHIYDCWSPAVFSLHRATQAYPSLARLIEQARLSRNRS